MAVTILDIVNNQWYVQRVNGEPELCHNAATAETLCRQYVKEEEAEWKKTVETVCAFPALQQQEAV